MKVVKENSRQVRISNSDKADRNYNITADVTLENGNVSFVSGGKIKSLDDTRIFGTFSKGQMANGNMMIECDESIGLEVTAAVYALLGEAKEMAQDLIGLAGDEN